MPRMLSCLPAGALALALAVPALATEGELPDGPIHERHELMEEIGANAKKIGQAMKTGATDEIAAPAKAISEAAPKVLPLFPEGSTHPKSRALDEIWRDWTGYERANQEFENAAAALVAATETDAPMPPAVKRLFDSCKGCHESYRAPEE